MTFSRSWVKRARSQTFSKNAFSCRGILIDDATSNTSEFIVARVLRVNYDHCCFLLKLHNLQELHKIIVGFSKRTFDDCCDMIVTSGLSLLSCIQQRRSMVYSAVLLWSCLMFCRNVWLRLTRHGIQNTSAVWCVDSCSVMTVDFMSTTADLIAGMSGILLFAVIYLL